MTKKRHTPAYPSELRERGIHQFRMSRSAPRVLAVTTAKLLLHPLVVGIGFWMVFGWDDPLAQDSVLFAFIPLF